MAALDDKELPEILYIMGMARCGTTILEIILSNAEGFTGVGEAGLLFRDAFRGDVRCGCGERAADCGLWGPLIEAEGWAGERVERLRRLHRRVDHHAGFPITLAGLRPQRSLREYAAVARAIYSAAAGREDARVVIDSTKYAGRALNLARLFGGRVRVVCITRSPSGLLASFGKRDSGEQPAKTPAAAVAYYLYTYASIRLARRILGERALDLRYEDLSADPETALDAIEGWSGWDLTAARQRLRDGAELEVGHMVTGNRIRHQRALRFDRRAGEGSVLGGAQRAAAVVMSSWRSLVGRVVG